jgi:hypothetical protein
MRSIPRLYLLLILVLVGCAPVSPTTQQTETVRSLYPTMLPSTNAATLAWTPTPFVIETLIPATTQTLQVTLQPKSVKETIQPLLLDPFNCTDPCFLGITPGKTSLDEVSAFFSSLGFKHKEGNDPNSGKTFYSVSYEEITGRNSDVTFYSSNNWVENIEIRPEITKQKAGSPREWITYSPETMIKKYGKPSRVEFALDLGQENITLSMIMYFDSINLITLYSGYEEANLFSSQFCPLAFPFDYVNILMGTNSPDSPQFSTISLEEATSLTVDQFSQLMLEDPQNACFTLKDTVFK